eukprot:gene14218-8253_t
MGATVGALPAGVPPPTTSATGPFVRHAPGTAAADLTAPLADLRGAHALQQCNNFKAALPGGDPGVQRYGGELFTAVRDNADDIFTSLPPSHLR